MYLYKISKVKENLPEVLEEDSKYLFIQKKDYNDPEVIDLHPYLTKIKKKITVVNIDKIKKENNIPEKVNCGMYSVLPNGYEYGFDGKVVTIADKDIQKYLLHNVEDGYICNCENIDYWRKDYSLQDLFYEVIDKNMDLNCVYNILNNKQLREIEEFVNKTYEKSEDEAIFYFEWY